MSRTVVPVKFSLPVFDVRDFLFLDVPIVLLKTAYFINGCVAVKYYHRINDH